MRKLQLASIISKIEDDLRYRLPTSGRQLSCVMLSREQAETLLTEISDLILRAGGKDANRVR